MIRALVLCLLAASYEMRAGVTPVQKVLQLMDDMLAKAETEKKDEEVAFTTFKTWCDNTAKNKQAAVEKAEELMEQLEADIAAADSDVVTLTDEIASLDADTDAEEKKGKEAREVRATEKADYHKTHADYTESLEQLRKAEKVLGATQVEVPQAMMLLQTMKKNTLMPTHAVSKLTSFLSEAPAVAGYESQSGDLVELFVDLEHDFKDKRNQLERDELEAKHGYDFVMQGVQDAIEKLKKQRGRKMERKAQRQEDGATARGELKDTTASRDEDQKYLDDTVSGCEQKSSDFEARQKLRAGELEAIKKAIEIISGQAVSGSADKHLPALMQRASAQLLRASTAAKSQDEVAEFLAHKATELNSKMLSMLAEHAAADPFVKVRKMIKDMIIRLTEEAAQESEHKGWCDGELGANKLQRESKTEDVNALTAQSDQLTADIAKLTQEISDLSTEISELDAALASASDIRTKENAKNKATVADAKAAQEAVKSALAVLKEFYAKAAEATALMQAPMDDAPATFDTAFKGQQAESGGVVGMLEVIASDFARLESDTSAAEESAADEYKTFTSDSAIDKATMGADVDGKTKLKTRKEGELTTATKDLKGAQAELDASLAYYDKLKPTCVDAGVSYEERVARRAAEIQSLQEALKILSGEDI
jgi:chromosome segregation ATPase